MLKIAVIEDDEGLSEIYQTSLTADGYQVVIARDGEAGLALIQAEKPDLILLDIMMPKVSGDQVLAEMRKSAWGKDIPVIIMTNISEAEIPNTLRQLNYSALLIKANNSPSQIIEMVKKILNPPAETVQAVTS